MFSRVFSLKMILLITLCSGLASCDLSTNAARSSESGNVIEGSSHNFTSDGVKGGTISGGGDVTFPNLVLKDFGVISGGRGNTAGNFSTVGGGEANTSEGIRATIGGGASNTANRNSAVIAGGYGNKASQSFATIGGGNVNTADGMYTTISGGSGNRAVGRMSTIGGGTRNQALSAYATVGGGSYNLAIGGTSTIAGGTGNQALGIGSTIGGGAGNNTAGLQSTISGGLSNRVTDNYSLVAGGRQNVAGNENNDLEDAVYASVGGGYGNHAGGAYATVPGGHANQAMGDYSIAVGNQAQIDSTHPGTFLFADSNDFPFHSSAPNEFAVRATGGVRFVTALDRNGTPLTGVQLVSGSGSWETLSDRTAKAAVIPVDSHKILERLMEVPVSTWRYIGQDETVRHIGPMAQDFYAAFGMGTDEHFIGSVDADGVSMAAIQGLYQVVQEKDARISVLESQNAEMKQRLDALESRLTRLEKNVNVQLIQINWILLAALLLGLTMGRYLITPFRKAILGKR